MADYQFGVIGAGNMAEALLRGVIGANFLSCNAIVAADPALERRQLLTRDLSITCSDDNAVPAACPNVLLAVKPQMMGQVLEQIAPAVRDDALVISIAAGVPSSQLAAKLGGKGRLVRVMPNTPMLVGAGISAVSAGAGATAQDVQWTRRLFGACGQTVEVSEQLMDAVKAVSGSGPAYFFYLVEAMVAAGVADGLDPDVATTLAVQTCAGAARLMCETGDAPQVLRARVTSPGGTTQAAIEAMDAAGVKDSLIAAVRAATARGKELGQK